MEEEEAGSPPVDGAGARVAFAMGRVDARIEDRTDPLSSSLAVDRRDITSPPFGPLLCPSVSNAIPCLSGGRSQKGTYKWRASTSQVGHRGATEERGQ